MGTKVGIVGVTSHADGEEKGGLKLLGDGSGEAMQMFWTLSLTLKTRMSKGGHLEESKTSLTSRVRWSVAFSRRSRCNNSSCAHGGQHTLMVPHTVIHHN